jgi:hypothetical protein
LVIDDVAGLALIVNLWVASNSTRTRFGPAILTTQMSCAWILIRVPALPSTPSTTLSLSARTPSTATSTIRPSDRSSARIRLTHTLNAGAASMVPSRGACSRRVSPSACVLNSPSCRGGSCRGRHLGGGILRLPPRPSGGLPLCGGFDGVNFPRYGRR